MNNNDLYLFSQRSKEEDFDEKYKKRACHEGKNGELKWIHKLSRARGYGLRCMSQQAKLTALAVNLKRIAAIDGSLSSVFLNVHPKISFIATEKVIYAS